VARGVAPGPTLCLTGGVHGDELNGIEIVRRSLEEANPAELAGTLIGVPIVNVHGFRRGSRYLPDRRDLNRFFPGSRRGSSAGRIAFTLFENVIRRCDALVDMHSGSFWRTNLARLARGFGSPIVLHHAGRSGTLRRAAVEAGIPAVTYEAGEPMRFQREEIERGVEGVRSLARALGMLATPPARVEPEVLVRSRWVRVDDGGILTSEVRLGDRVEVGELLGRVIDPIDGQRAEVRSPQAGLVIGMAQDQLVIPGFAAYHLATAPVGGDTRGETQPVDAGPPPDSHLPDGPELDERPE
jgi:predicted deacylase